MYALLKSDAFDMRVERVCSTTDQVLGAYARLLASSQLGQQMKPERAIGVLHTVRHKGDIVDPREITILYKDL